MEEEAAYLKRDKSTSRGQEWRSARKGGLNSPKNASRSTKNAVGMENAAGFFFCSWDEKMDGDYKVKLAAGTVGFEAGVSLFNDPISDVVKCI
ncbi:hypothetical protein TNCV_4541541 [Trichonephila clavipes]|nr:hypothetical protein TNCV_4541541 [Trichonephila clavipes]